MLYVINGALQWKLLICFSFALGVNANARLIVKVGTDDRPVAKFDATMFYVINGALQQKFLTCLSFALGVDTNARPVVRLVQMIDWSLSLMLQCFMSLIVLSNRNFNTSLFCVRG